MRIPRSLIVFPGYPVHKIWRGHNKEWNLKTPKEKQKYLSFLKEEIEKFPDNKLQAFTLMSNHTHEIHFIEDPETFSNSMRRHHSRYGAFYNRKHSRCGKVAQDRPRTCLIEDDTYYMRATFYIHANPVRAKMCKDAKNYAWSTHSLYAFGKNNYGIKLKIGYPDWYMALGKTWTQRRKKYRQLFDAYLREKGMIQDRFYDKPFFGSDEWQIPFLEKIKAWRIGKSPPV